MKGSLNGNCCTTATRRNALKLLILLLRLKPASEIKIIFPLCTNFNFFSSSHCRWLFFGERNRKFAFSSARRLFLSHNCALEWSFRCKFDFPEFLDFIDICLHTKIAFRFHLVSDLESSVVRVATNDKTFSPHWNFDRVTYVIGTIKCKFFHRLAAMLWSEPIPTKNEIKLNSCSSKFTTTMKKERWFNYELRLFIETAECFDIRDETNEWWWTTSFVYLNVRLLFENLIKFAHVGTTC